MTAGRIDGTSLLQAAAPPSLAGTAKREFAALLLEQLARPAAEPVFGETPLDGGAAGRTYRQLFLAEVSRRAAARGELGIGSLLGESFGAEAATR
ncbi:MAG: hypothetical protein QNK03_12595 [Myxococcota bacterium]|nr:hypothetical protein [Myxococcota bacterium]